MPLPFILTTAPRASRRITASRHRNATHRAQGPWSRSGRQPSRIAPKLSTDSCHRKSCAQMSGLRAVAIIAETTTNRQTEAAASSPILLLGGSVRHGACTRLHHASFHTHPMLPEQRVVRPLLQLPPQRPCRMAKPCQALTCARAVVACSWHRARLCSPRDLRMREVPCHQAVPASPDLPSRRVPAAPLSTTAKLPRE